MRGIFDTSFSMGSVKNYTGEATRTEPFSFTTDEVAKLRHKGDECSILEVEITIPPSKVARIKFTRMTACTTR